MHEVDVAIEKLANPAKARVLAGFFKTGPGQYGEGDVFLGITVPQSRLIAREFAGVSLVEIKALLDSKIHEKRLVGLFILTKQFEKAIKHKDQKQADELVEFYLQNIARVNNWDLVDQSAPRILGRHLYNSGDWSLLKQFARSSDLWTRRIAIVATLAFIVEKRFEPTLEICQLLLNDEHDLIHKACGWMLREVGKRDEAVETAFLEKHYRKMPRTMLRYSIERFSPAKKAHFMAK